MADADERLRCWAIGIRLCGIAEELLDAADAAREEHPTRMGEIIAPPDLQRRIDEANAERIKFWAERFDRALTKSADCGVEANGHLGGEFGRLEDWLSQPDVIVLASMAQRVALATEESAGHELRGDD